MGYRRDIDGLRAVSVLAVVLFHAGCGGVSGGFVGVDVFFVISGYLITSIVLADLDKGRFSLATFYERRIRRIFPALFTMLLATGIVGSLLLLRKDFAELGRSAIAATLFVSNVFFHWTSDYFAGPAHLKPLLHTWSLSVEEQFYVVFPCLLWAIGRWGRGRWLLWLLPLLLASLALSMLILPTRPQATFYLAPMRAWELLAGAVLATGQVPALRRAWMREGAGALGLAMIAAAVTLYSDGTQFPGAAALLPCVGAALVIHSGQQGPTAASRLLSLRPVVALGLVSYSLYLWHWPLFVFARHWAGGPLTAEQSAVAIAASLVLAVLSWRFVEQPFRRHVVPPDGPGTGRGSEFGAIFATAAAVMLLAVVAGAGAHVSGGWPGRYPDYRPVEIVGRAAMKEGTCFLRPDQKSVAFPGLTACSSGPPEAPRVVVWGDSFAAHLVPGLSGAGGVSFRVSQVTASGCPPVAGLDLPRRPHCRGFNDRTLALIESERPDIIVLAARWEAYLGRVTSVVALAETLNKLRQYAGEMIIVGQGPSFDFDSPYDADVRFDRETVPVNFDLRINEQLAQIHNATFFNPMPVLCQPRHCRLKEHGAYLYFDGGHLSTAGSDVVAKGLAPVIEAALLRTRQPSLPGVGSGSAWRRYGQLP